MKKVILKSSFVLLVCIVVTGMFFLNANNVSAASKNKWTIKMDRVYWLGATEGDKFEGMIPKNGISNGKQYGKVVHISGIDILLFVWGMDGEYYYSPAYKDQAQPGKYKVKVSWKDKAGKKLSRTETLRIKNYPNEIKSLKIDGKKVKIKEGNRFHHKIDEITNNEISIQMKLKKGWKIKKIFNFAMCDNGFEDFKLTRKMLAKGGKIKLPENCSFFLIKIDMEKDGNRIPYEIEYDATKDKYDDEGEYEDDDESEYE